MPRPGDSGESGSTRGSVSLLVLASDSARASGIAALLEPEGYLLTRVGSPEEATRALRVTRPALLILAEGEHVSEKAAWTELRNASRNLGTSILDILDAGPNSGNLTTRVGLEDDWVFSDRLNQELSLRAARLVRGRERAGKGNNGDTGIAPLDSHFIALLIHDLRTPLNVIGLSLRMIEQAVPKDDPELAEDLRFVDENFKQIERMLAQLSDYYRLFEPALRLSGTEFSPRRMLDELLETRTMKAHPKFAPALADVDPSCPEAVALDPIRARTAIDYALANAAAAANGEPILVVMRGDADRWVIEIRLKQPAPSSVQAHALHPQRFERLCASAAERRGMELAIAARVSALFGGSARLDVANGNGTAIVLDWPTRLPDA